MWLLPCSLWLDLLSEPAQGQWVSSKRLNETLLPQGRKTGSMPSLQEQIDGGIADSVEEQNQRDVFPHRTRIGKPVDPEEERCNGTDNLGEPASPPAGGVPVGAAMGRAYLKTRLRRKVKNCRLCRLYGAD